MDQRRWTVLLIGGSGGTGKTTLAAAIGRRFEVPWGQVDDFRLALQRITTEAERPELHFFVGGDAVWELPPETLRDRLIEVGRVVSRALEIVVSHRLATSQPLVLEGDGILPSLAARRAFVGRQAHGEVRSVFLCEDDEKIILTRMRGRGRGFQERAREVQQAQARLNLLYGRWLREEARRRGLPVMAARPNETLSKRVVAAITYRIHHPTA